MKNLTITKAKFNLKFKNEVNINILSKIKLPKTTICVISTSINNTIINLLLNILNNENFRVITNKNCLNLKELVDLLVNASTPNGDLNTDVLLLTISPKYANVIFKYLTPTYIFIKENLENIKSLPKTSHLILNADNPKHLMYIGDNPYTLYGIEVNKNIFKNEFSNIKIKCPNCNENLIFNYYYDDNLGNYYCPNCNLKRQPPSVQLTQLNYQKNIIIINDIYKINLKELKISNIYNILLCFTISKLLNINLDNVSNFFYPLPKTSKEIKKYSINKRIVYVTDTKILSEALTFIKENKELKTLIINLSETQNLYELNFEILKNNEIDKIVCTGNKNYDVAVRIKYSNIDEEKIVAIQDIEEAVKYIKLRTEGNIYAILDNIEEFNAIMKGI